MNAMPALSMPMSMLSIRCQAISLNIGANPIENRREASTTSARGLYNIGTRPRIYPRTHGYKCFKHMFLLKGRPSRCYCMQESKDALAKASDVA